MTQDGNLTLLNLNGLWKFIMMTISGIQLQPELIPLQVQVGVALGLYICPGFRRTQQAEDTFIILLIQDLALIISVIIFSRVYRGEAMIRSHVFRGAGTHARTLPRTDWEAAVAGRVIMDHQVLIRLPDELMILRV
jgi:hypothetical protein